MKRTLTFALSISLCLLGYAQTEPETKKLPSIDPFELDELPDSIPYRYPLLNGLSVSFNIFPLALDLFGKDYRSYEAMVMLDLHHRFLPQFAAGIGNCDYTNDDGLRYQSDMAPFFKAGMAYNFGYNDKKGEDFYAVFCRYGFSSHKGSLYNITYNDGFWPEYGPTDLENLSFNSHWLEIGAMIKVQVMKHFSMGWDASFKPLLSKGKHKNGDPYFIPGYGTTSSKFGLGFHLYYDI